MDLSIPQRGHKCPSSPPAPDDAGDAGEVGAGLHRGEAGLEEQLAHRRRLVDADLERQRRDKWGYGWDRRADDVEPIGAGEQRLAWLPPGHLRLQAPPLRLTYVGKVGDDQIELAGGGRQHRLDQLDPSGETESRRVGARYFERRR